MVIVDIDKHIDDDLNQEVNIELNISTDFFVKEKGQNINLFLLGHFFYIKVYDALSVRTEGKRQCGNNLDIRITF